MRNQPVHPERLNIMLLGALSMVALVVLTMILGLASVIDVRFTLVAILLCLPPAFIMMLLADKI